MKSRFDLSWDSIPRDGASTPIGVSTPPGGPDCDELLEAWSLERNQCIELGFYLDRALRLLNRVVAEGEVSPRSRRRVKDLLLAVRESRRGRA
jgi:hypothetical protein